MFIVDLACIIQLERYVSEKKRIEKNLSLQFFIWEKKPNGNCLQIGEEIWDRAKCIKEKNFVVFSTITMIIARIVMNGARNFVVRNF